MKSFKFQITEARGLHARVAAELAAYAAQSKSQVYLNKGRRSVNMERCLDLLSLRVVSGELVEVTIVGEAEEETFAYLKNYFETHL